VPTTRPYRRHLAAVVAAAALAAATACGSAAGSSTDAANNHPTSYPTRDVISGIKADPKLTAELPASVRQDGTLRLGTTITPGSAGLPHGGQINGKLVGLDVDLRNAVARILGIEWKVDNGSFATIIPGVQNGRYDVGQDNFGVTKQREKVVDFATYLNDGQGFLVPDDSPLHAVHNLTQLCGRTIGTGAGTTFQQLLTDGANECQKAGKQPYHVQYYADSGPIILGLTNGKLDVYFGPTLALKYDARHVAHTRFAGQYSSTPVGFVTAKRSPLAPVLRDAVNALIATGAYARIFKKWGVTSSGVSRSSLNPPATF
jgi:polar amino acid transport system substrate-binding protein